MNNYFKIQRAYLTETAEFLKSINEKNAGIKLDGKWSIKEIIGHLIDSASNNHQRFVRAVFKDDLIFEGYDQNKWVDVQNYNSSDWHELINAWLYFNLIIINSISSFPSDILSKECKIHNFNKIAWQTIPENQLATLDYLIKDYYGHLKHHVDVVKNNTTKLEN